MTNWKHILPVGYIRRTGRNGMPRAMADLTDGKRQKESEGGCSRIMIEMQEGE